MTPSQERAISRLEARGHITHMERRSLPSEVKASLDEYMPKSLPAIVRHGRTRKGEIYWYRDWCHEY